MGKMKEEFIKINYPDWDLEREYLIDDYLKQEKDYLDYLELKGIINSDESKIEVKDGRETRIEVYKENNEINKSVKRIGS
jgi:hypothetical protein